ncbi:MAG: DUF11 domain-containing protein [Gemmataceae bacterium]|nr:DUF11 domain-containing protein [Gemmataceae bacterium]
MNRRWNLGLWFVLAAALGAVGQPPADERPPIEDPEVQQAQNLESPVRPGRRVWNGQLTSLQGPVPAPTSTVENRPPASLPPQPPTPTVQISVLVPRDHPPGQDIPCTITVTNATSAEAHRVVVRLGELEGAQTIAADPKPADAQSLNWSFKVLKGNESQKIELKLRPLANASSVSVKAFVSFEHGQAVKTTLSEPKLTVKTELPKQATSDQPVAVRVTVRNGGRVPIMGAKLTQTLGEGFEFHKDIAGGEATKQANQRLWTIGTIQPGETKTLQYLVTATKGRALRVLSVVDAEGKLQANDTAETTVLDANLRVQLTGDGKANGEQTAHYEATVTNTGTVPLENVRLAGAVPDDCRLTKMTRGGKEYQGQVLWSIAKLAPGESQSFRWGLQCLGGGRRAVRAVATARGLEDVARTETVFPGTANLSWQSNFDRDTVAIDQQGVFTVVVRNSGTEAAGNARLTITLPKGSVSLVQASPLYKQTGETIAFEPRSIPAGKSETFTITFRGEQYGRAYFSAKLTADALGDRPLGAEKYVEVTRR